MAFHLDSATVSDVRTRTLDATQRYLGACMRLGDDDWQAPSLLPGWTRAHIAAHLAGNARAMSRVAADVAAGAPGRRGPDSAHDLEEWERDSERPALDLIIDLDTTASDLEAGFASVGASEWRLPVAWQGWPSMEASALPLARLCEVELHHIDMGLGYTPGDVPPGAATLLLEWCVELRHLSEAPVNATLVTSSGAEWVVGVGGPIVSGTVGGLLGWLSGRGGPDSVRGDVAPLPPV